MFHSVKTSPFVLSAERDWAWNVWVLSCMQERFHKGSAGDFERACIKAGDSENKGKRALERNGRLTAIGVSLPGPLET